MNFLAHTLFADGNSERVAGQIGGDFVRGKDLSTYPPGVRQGIERHRLIDAYTDRHPAGLRARALFEPPLRRFAGIITDVMYDYYLVRDWDRYSDIPLDQHIADVHDALHTHRAVLPAGLHRFAVFLRREQVFESYREFTGVEQTLQRIARRGRRFAVLHNAAGEARRHRDTVGVCFEELFTDLRQHMALSADTPDSGS